MQRRGRSARCRGPEPSARPACTASAIRDVPQVLTRQRSASRLARLYRAKSESRPLSQVVQSVAWGRLTVRLSYPLGGAVSSTRPVSRHLQVNPVLCEPRAARRRSLGKGPRCLCCDAVAPCTGRSEIAEDDVSPRDAMREPQFVQALRPFRIC